MPERLGRYLLERKLAIGGMAEVFLARQEGPSGFSRACVVKRMLDPLTGDPNFVAMFLDEARLAAQLSHPHIAQIFDFGEHQGAYFIAMEYVPGVDLEELITYFKVRGEYVPLPEVARIGAQIATALDHAHAARS